MYTCLDVFRPTIKYVRIYCTTHKDPARKLFPPARVRMISDDENVSLVEISRTGRSSATGATEELWHRVEFNDALSRGFNRAPHVISDVSKCPTARRARRERQGVSDSSVRARLAVVCLIPRGIYNMATCHFRFHQEPLSSRRLHHCIPDEKPSLAS